MHGFEFIKQYFASNNDKILDEQFRNGAGFFNIRNYTYKYEKFNKDKLRIFFKDRSEYRDKAIIENGKRVGVATLADPHTIVFREGTFICSGVKKVVDKKPYKGFRANDLRISKRLFTQGLRIIINNTNLNVRIECDGLYPESFTSKTQKISE